MDETDERGARRRGSRRGLAARSSVRAGGRTVAWITAHRPGGPEGVLELRLERAEGAQPDWARRLLLHDVLNRAQRAGVARIELVASAPDDEVLAVVRERCAGVHVHVQDDAGAGGRTLRVDAELPPAPAPDAARRRRAPSSAGAR